MMAIKVMAARLLIASDLYQTKKIGMAFFPQRHRLDFLEKKVTVV